MGEVCTFLSRRGSYIPFVMALKSLKCELVKPAETLHMALTQKNNF